LHRTLKFPKTLPLPCSDGREWAEKIFSNNPKVPENDAVTCVEADTSVQKFFETTLKLFKKLTLIKNMEVRDAPESAKRAPSNNQIRPLFS
jgi:hypothetical protein